MLPKEQSPLDVDYTLDFSEGVSQYLKGPKRLEDESYSDYKLRRANENKILRLYLKGRPFVEEDNYNSY